MKKLKSWRGFDFFTVTDAVVLVLALLIIVLAIGFSGTSEAIMVQECDERGIVCRDLCEGAIVTDYHLASTIESGYFTYRVFCPPVCLDSEGCVFISGFE